MLNPSLSAHQFALISSWLGIAKRGMKPHNAKPANHVFLAKEGKKVSWLCSLRGTYHSYVAILWFFAKLRGPNELVLSCASSNMFTLPVRCVKFASVLLFRRRANDKSSSAWSVALVLFSVESHCIKGVLSHL